ncbi:MAG: RNA polymerase sigma factor [Pirellulaceae bacterium]
MRSDHVGDSAMASTAPTAEELLLSFQQGNQSSLAEMVGIHEQRLAQIAYRIVGCPSEAEDVRHAVFVQLLITIRELRQINNVGAWLTRCTVNEALTRVRQRDRTSRLKMELIRRGSRVADTTPLEQLQDHESREQLAAALAKLSPEERALVSLRFDENLTYREIGEVLERPASTIKSQLSKAIARLRTALGGNP